MKEKTFYITTTIPYVNADPHMGFALELVQSDAIARYHRLKGEYVFFSTGTDEHGQKIWEASQKDGKDVKSYVDYYAKNYSDLTNTLNLSNDNFIRTTDENHVKAAQEMWSICESNGDIYKKKYKGLYCVGCEKFLTERDLIDGKCNLHPNKEPEMVEEENYFFKLTNYRHKLLDYLSQEHSIYPEWRRKEALEYVKEGMEDFSISRSKERFSWGVPVPNDDTQVMYVWFDALVNYISTLGWPQNKEKFEKFWQNGYHMQTAGKDMVKFQSVMWQGMLFSAGITPTSTVIYHGFITAEGGVRMSKSLGNGINPNDIVSEYGTDALRYFLLREVSSFEDSPFTMERFKDAYNAHLANGLGNLVSRIMKMASDNLEGSVTIPEWEDMSKYFSHLETFEVNKAADFVWNEIADMDKYIQDNQPFKVVKTDAEKGREMISNLVVRLYSIARMLNPLLPETSEKIKTLIKENKVPEKSLFQRKD